MKKIKKIAAFALTIASLYNINIQAQEKNVTDSQPKYKVISLGINSVNNEYGPAFFGKDLMYVAYNMTKGGNHKRHSHNHHHSGLLLYNLNHTKTSNMHSEVSLPPELRYKVGPSAFADSSQTLFMTIFENQSRSKARGRIYQAKTEAGALTEHPSIMPFVDNDFSYAYPTITPDGKHLIFASDMPGGMGGFDLYVSDLTGSSWSKPQNLGEEINTEKDEVYPFLHTDGTLYFSSDGLPGLGKLDVFEARGSNYHYTSPKNLGSPVNSPSDDFGLILDFAKRDGFFSSDRVGTLGYDDIYYLGVNMLAKSRQLMDNENLYARGLLTVAGKITDQDSGKPVDGVSIKINRLRGEESFAMKPNSEGEFSQHIDNDAVYVLTASKQGYKDAAPLLINTMGLEKDQKLIKNFVMERAKYDFKIKGIVNEDKTNQSIPFAKVRISMISSRKEEVITASKDGFFEYMLPQDEDFEIHFAKDGYLGTRPFHVSTKKKAASQTFQIDPIMEKEIETAFKLNCKTVDAATSRPIKNCKVRMIDHKTRRVLLEKYTPQSGEVVFNLEANQKYIFEAVADSFSQDNYVNIYTKTMQPGQTVNETIRLTKNKDDLSFLPDSFQLPTVYFEQAFGTLSEQNYRDIDKVVEGLKTFPLLKISIATYTDSKGSKRYNEQVSEQRSEEIFLYMVKQGIDPLRIVSKKGFGEQFLKNGCEDGVECTEEQHAQNRRTEFTIIR